LNADVLGVSRDRPDTLTKYKAEKSLPFDFHSDRRGEVHRAFGVVRRLGLGVKRVTFLVAPGGTIQALSAHEIRITAHVEEMLQALKST